MKIVVCCEGSAGSCFAVRAAKHCFARENDEVVLYYCRTSKSDGGKGDDLEMMLRENDIEGERLVIEDINETDDIAGTIVKYLKSVCADMVVLGSTGRSAASAIGSVARYVAKYSHCSCALIRPSFRFTSNCVFMVGVDGSRYSQSALRAAVRLARRYDDIVVRSFGVASVEFNEECRSVLGRAVSDGTIGDYSVIVDSTASPSAAGEMVPQPSVFSRTGSFINLTV
eukprot:c3322_g1_i1.p1 GENE.c3322_g1_i1~~c3322_g1_i1.p1  ORF type:complete len:227 (-),score=57.83 c3322_g1_i1:25-705(-)